MSFETDPVNNLIEKGVFLVDVDVDEYDGDGDIDILKRIVTKVILTIMIRT